MQSFLGICCLRDTWVGQAGLGLNSCSRTMKVFLHTGQVPIKKLPNSAERLSFLTLLARRGSTVPLDGKVENLTSSRIFHTSDDHQKNHQPKNIEGISRFLKKLTGRSQCKNPLVGDRQSADMGSNRFKKTFLRPEFLTRLAASIVLSLENCVRSSDVQNSSSDLSAV